MGAGRCAWGPQFHPEMTVEMLKRWFDYYPVDLNKDKMLLDYFCKKGIYNWQAKLIYLNFACIIAKETESRKEISKTN